MRIHPTKRRVALLMAPVLAAGLALGACGDDDDTEAAATTDAPTASDAPATTTGGDTTAAATGEDLDTFCSTAVALEGAAAAGDEIEPDDTEANKAFAASLLPFLADMEASAPASAKASLGEITPVVEAAAASGDVSTFETPEFDSPLNELHAAGIESCEWATTDVEMQDYHFMGLPATLTSGVMSFELTNTGNEPHVMIVVRKNDGVTESFDEILAMT